MRPITSYRLYNSWWLNIIMPIIIGSCIYIFWRSYDIRVFRWFETLSIDNDIIVIRQLFYPVGLYIPQWILYSLPTSLWTYSTTACMILLWRNEFNIEKYMWLAIGPVLGIGSELAQWVKLIHGTFDKADLICNIVASFLAFLLLYRTEGVKKCE